MFKSSLFIVFVVLLSAGGCATVSVIPGASSGEQTVSIQQSALRTAANEFTEQATEQGWIEGLDRTRSRYDAVRPHSGSRK